MDYIKEVISFLFGATLTHLWSKFKERILVIEYRVTYQALGSSISDQSFGNIEILYNKHPMQNLFYTEVVLENHTTKDLTNVRFNIYPNDNEQIAMSYGILEGSPNPLRFTAEYQQILDDASKGVNSELFYTRRDYVVPVLNRKAKVIFRLLLNSNHPSPLLHLNSDHPGLRIQEASAQPIFWGEPQKYCLWAGCFLSTSACFAIIKFIPEHYNLTYPFIGPMLGLFVLSIGWILVRFVRTTLRMLS